MERLSSTHPRSAHRPWLHDERAPLRCRCVGEDIEAAGFVVSTFSHEDHVAQYLVRADGQFGATEFYEVMAIAPASAKKTLLSRRPRLESL